MKRKKIYLLVQIVILVALTSCNHEEKPKNIQVNQENECRYCDSTLYKRVYSKDGYILLSDRKVNDSVAFSKKSGPIGEDTAARMVRYFANNVARRKYPIVIDFDITSINKIVQLLNDINTGDDEKKSLRVYLAGYDRRALELAYPDVPVSDRIKLLNYTTGILIGRYDSAEATIAINLGNLCPPNCIPPQSIVPNEAKSKIFRMSLKRGDVQ